MQYKIYLCDDPATAFDVEADEEKQAEALNQEIVDIIRTKIGDAEKIKFRFVTKDGGGLQTERRIPPSFKPSGDEILVQFVIKDK